MNLNKLKDQKGLTGIDVVIAITIISTMTLAVLAIYVNLISGSKKSTRTGNATRIATSILQTIDAMYYADVEEELDRIKLEAGITDWPETFEVTLTDGTVFGTKIQNGYTVTLNSTDIYSATNNGIYTSEGTAMTNASMVFNVKVTVSYYVSGREEHITLKTIKKRELLNECNEPDLNALLGTTVEGKRIKSLNQIQPIKWSMVADGYVKTNESDGDWYNYSRRDWAKVVVFADSTAFNTSDGTISPDALNNSVTYIWIPRFGKSAVDYNIAFAYGSTNSRIKKLSMDVGDSLNNKRTFKFYGVKLFNRTAVTDKMQEEEILSVDESAFPEGYSGIWLNVSGGYYIFGSNIKDVNNYYFVNELNESQYGPIVTYYGKTYY